MRVKFLQSGGVVGAVRGCDLDTTTLPSAEARQLESLVHSSGLPASGEFRSPDSRDLRLYEIRVESESHAIAVTFDEHTVPERARPLISFLRRNATPRALD